MIHAKNGMLRCPIVSSSLHAFVTSTTSRTMPCTSLHLNIHTNCTHNLKTNLMYVSAHTDERYNSTYSRRKIGKCL